MDKIAAFDTLYTNNHIQICKLLFPLIPKDKQYYFAIFIKFLELQHTIQYGQKLQYQSDDCKCEKLDYKDLCQEVLPYCTHEEEQFVRKLQDILKAMDTFQSLKPMFEMMNQFSMSGNGEGGDFSGFDISSLFSMGDLFQGNLNPDLLNNLKDLMPDSANDLFSQEYKYEEPIIKNEDRSKSYE